MCHVKEGDIEAAGFKEGLKAGMVSPEVEVAVGNVGEDVAKGVGREVGLVAQVMEVAEKMKGEPSRPRSQFAEIQWLVNGCGVGGELMVIVPEGKDNFGIAAGDRGVAGDVMGNFALSPGFDTAIGKVLSL